MRSGTSFFNFTLFKKTFLRFWPLWAANLVVWLVVFPLNLLLRIQNGERGEYLYSMTASLMQRGGAPIVVGALALTTMVAMATCSHLYNPRSANFFAVLPVRREGVFLSTWAAGLAILMGPNLVIFVLTALTEALGGALLWTPLLFWLGAVCGIELFFYSFAVFCGMFTGHILALPVFTGVFNVFAMAVYGLMQWVMSGFYYGYTPVNGDAMETVVKALTPAWALSEVSCSPGDWKNYDAFRFEGAGALAVYAGAGLVFALLALLLYRRRQMESAGDIVAVRCMRPVFRYGVALCAGFAFGLLTALVLNMGELGLMAAILLWGVAGSFAAQMMLDKSFKVFHKWRGSAAVAGVFLLLFLVVGLDLTGYETRVPDPASVECAEVTGLGALPYDGADWWSSEAVSDPENVALVTELHRLAVEERDRTGWLDATDAWSFRVVYHLKNGGVMARSYTLYGREADLGVEGTAANLAQRLTDDIPLTRQRYGFDRAARLVAEGGRLTSVQLHGVTVYGNDIEWTEYGSWSGGYISSEDGPQVSVEEILAGVYPDTASNGEPCFYGTDALGLWSAVEGDLAAGNIGRHWIVGGEQVETGLYFTFEGPAGDDSTAQHIDIALPDTAASTWAALEALGVRR